jgi:creatinine amidohydrolase
MPSGVGPTPEGMKVPVDVERLRWLAPAAIRAELGDGCYGGAYRKPDEDMLRLWQVGVEETRSLIDAV